MFTKSPIIYRGKQNRGKDDVARDQHVSPVTMPESPDVARSASVASHVGDSHVGDSPDIVRSSSASVASHVCDAGVARRRATLPRVGHIDVGVPVVNVVVFVMKSCRQIAEHRPDAVVVRYVVKLEFSRVVDVDRELGRQAFAHFSGGRCRLRFRNSVELLHGGAGLEALPRESALQEVHGHVADCF